MSRSGYTEDYDDQWGLPNHIHRRTAPMNTHVKANPGKLSFKATGPHGQSEIKSDYHRLDGEWDDIYVAFGGHFGSYGPQMFAAAPELMNALRSLVDHVDAAYPGNALTAHGKAALRGAGTGVRAMKLPFTADICDCLPEIECILDADIEWDMGSPVLIINDVLCSQGKASLMHAADKLVSDTGYRIADLAEDDERLLARAVEEYVFEERAA